MPYCMLLVVCLLYFVRLLLPPGSTRPDPLFPYPPLFRSPMKLYRHAAPGAEKPGLVDAEGRIRDLSAHVADIDGAAIGPEGLAKLAGLDPASLPLEIGRAHV